MVALLLSAFNGTISLEVVTPASPNPLLEQVTLIINSYPFEN